MGSVARCVLRWCVSPVALLGKSNLEWFGTKREIDLLLINYLERDVPLDVTRCVVEFDI